MPKDLASVLADMSAGGATSLRQIAAELNLRGMPTRSRAWACLRHAEPFRPAWRAEMLQRRRM